MKKEVFKATSHTNPNQLAGAIAGIMRDGCYLEIQAIGAGAINQSIKAIAIARGFLAPTGIFITCLPAFTEIDINGEKKTGIKLQVEAQELH